MRYAAGTALGHHRSDGGKPCSGASRGLSVLLRASAVSQERTRSLSRRLMLAGGYAERSREESQ